jgi:two-component system response regulator AlgR
MFTSHLLPFEHAYRPTPRRDSKPLHNTPLSLLLVDEDAAARQRLKTLLGDCDANWLKNLHEASTAVTAMAVLDREPIDIVLLEVKLPGTNGLGLACHLGTLRRPPMIIFITAHAEHAARAFDLDAVDYITKPVRLERLQEAFDKAERRMSTGRIKIMENPSEALIIQDRGRTERVPLAEVLYFKAEQKYVTVRTAVRCYILDDSLSELERRYSTLFLRVHRNALVAKSAIRTLERHYSNDQGDGWAIRLQGLEERLLVSRRQLTAVREAIRKL